MRRLTDISMGSVSTLLPVYPYNSVLVSDTFLDEATGTFTKNNVKLRICCQSLQTTGFKSTS